MKSKSYSTAEAAKMVGVTRATLQEWIKRRMVETPQIQVRLGQSPARFWTGSDIVRLKAIKRQIKTGRPRKKGIEK